MGNVDGGLPVPHVPAKPVNVSRGESRRWRNRHHEWLGSHLVAALELDPQRIATRTRGRGMEHQFGGSGSLGVAV